MRPMLTLYSVKIHAWYRLNTLLVEEGAKLGDLYEPGCSD
ncbi:hypothetical protein BOW93_gp040 [Salmonella phage 118970_sal3]|nr:hypothetical protein BOW93_gp040 [Salmonella phage 118970_sal3]AOP04179.1 hypothetical protein 118970sal3_00040 [Salmonella phage 118970_sal3]